MKLLYQTHSPYARKVLVAAHEMGLERKLTVIHHETSPTRRNEEVFALNPLGKVPVLICDDGTVVYDSNVICEYLDELHAGTRLIPRDAPARWRALKMQALAQGISDAGIAARWETERRPAHVRWPVMHDGQIEKIAAACDFLERKLALGGLARGGESNAARCVAPAVDSATGFGAAPDIGDIALATALSWIEFRGVYPFLKGRPQLGRWYDAISARPSMLATALAGETQD